jgi:hypothetical protein
MIEVGTKMLDLEDPVLWGIVWRVTPVGSRGINYRIRWCDGSVTRGLNSRMLDRAGYVAQGED